MTELTLESYNLRRMMREKGIEERIGHWVDCLRRSDGQVEVVAYDLYRDGSQRTSEPANGKFPRRLGNTAEILTCDTVVLCTARESRTELYDALIARRDEWSDRGIEVVARAGECLAPRYLADAIFDGHRIAREFELPEPGASKSDDPGATDLGPRRLPEARERRALNLAVGRRSPKSKTLRIFAVMTTDANGATRQLHDRVP